MEAKRGLPREEIDRRKKEGQKDTREKIERCSLHLYTPGAL